MRVRLRLGVRKQKNLEGDAAQGFFIVLVSFSLKFFRYQIETHHRINEAKIKLL